MNSKNIFVGNVMMCHGFKGIIGIDDCKCEPVVSEIEKDVILIKVGDDRYIDIRNFTPSFNLILFLDKILHSKSVDHDFYFPSDRTMGIEPYFGGEHFINESTLHKYCDESKDISLRQLKKGII